MSEISLDELQSQAEVLVDRIYNLELSTEADKARLNELQHELSRRGITTTITTDITFEDTQISEN